MNRYLKLLPLMTLSLAASACIPPWWLFEDDDGYDDPPPVANPSTPTNSVQAPNIESFDIPSWPPLGPDGEIGVTISDDRGLAQVDLSFRNQVSKQASGTQDTIWVTGTELGEGFGTLTVVASDFDGATATRWVDDLLVDLTPPEIYLGETVLRPDTELELWVADAWVLGDVTIDVGAVSLTHAFDAGYPPTLGNDWDYSLVSFAGSQLPQGKAVAKLTARDAAGNATTLEFDLNVDGQPPSASIDQPANGTQVSGNFQVDISAADPGGGPVWIELLAGGTQAATAVGPDASVVLDAADFSAGPLVLQAVARDEAGNETASSEITVLIP